MSTTTGSVSKRFECDNPGCARDFATANALAIHKGRAHGAKKAPVPKQDTAPDSEIRDCPHVDRCGVEGVTYCGADPCAAVQQWLEVRCEERTDTDCQNDPCYDCPVDVYRRLRREMLTAAIPDYRLEAIRAWATAAKYGAHQDAPAILDRIIQLAEEGER